MLQHLAGLGERRTGGRMVIASRGTTVNEPKAGSECGRRVRGQPARRIISPSAAISQVCFVTKDSRAIRQRGLAVSDQSRT
jgi:hypothetical protein